MKYSTSTVMSEKARRPRRPDRQIYKPPGARSAEERRKFEQVVSSRLCEASTKKLQVVDQESNPNGKRKNGRRKEVHDHAAIRPLIECVRLPHLSARSISRLCEALKDGPALVSCHQGMHGLQVSLTKRRRIFGFSLWCCQIR